MTGRICSLSLLFIVLSLKLTAQIQEQPGILVLNDGQELIGKITYFYDNPFSVHIVNEQGVATNFSSDQLQEIKLDNGRRFISREFDTGTERQFLIFQLVIETEKLSLFKRNIPDNRFYISENNKLHALENNETVIYKDGKRLRKYDYKYTGTLSMLMNDRPDIIDKIKTVQLTERDLTSLLSEYAKGNVSYILTSNKKISREPYWAVLAYYGRHNSYLNTSLNSPSNGFGIGAQYYFDKSSRFSIRLSLDHTNYEYRVRIYNTYLYKTLNHQATSLSTKFQFDFLQYRTVNAYTLLHFVDFTHTNEREGESSNWTRAGLIFRFSPGVGLEAHPTKNFSFFGELNHILNFSEIGKNYTAGLRYSFIK